MSADDPGMSTEDEVRGPTMLAATNMLKPPPPVIGGITKEVTLPRTVRLTTLAVVAGGAMLGFLGTVFIFGPGLRALIYGPMLGGAAGWAAANFSPLPGESLTRWLGLRLSTARTHGPVVEGRPVRLYVGIAPLLRTAAGTVRMLPGGVPVDAVDWDSRGYPLRSVPRAGRRRGRYRLGRRPKASGSGRGRRRGTRGRRG